MCRKMLLRDPGQYYKREPFQVSISTSASDVMCHAYSSIGTAGNDVKLVSNMCMLCVILVFKEEMGISEPVIYSLDFS